MKAIPQQLNAARAVQDVAQGIIEDARRLDDIANTTTDIATRSALKSMVRQILNRSNSLAEAVQNIAEYK
jgi:hypothetical protein